MSCMFKDRKDTIEKYLQKELSEDEMNAFEEHYLSCNECFSELESTKQMIELIRKEGEELFPEFSGGHEKNPESNLNQIIKKYFGPGWYLKPSWGIAFAAVLILLVMIYLLNPAIKEDPDLEVNEKIAVSEENKGPQNDNTAAVDSVDEVLSNDIEVDLYAANFHESTDMEYLMNQNYRSDSVIDIISPQSGITANEEIIFSWDTDSDEHLLIKILNNVEDVLYKLTPENNRYKFSIIENNLDPGLYYWKLESDEELLNVGKFYVKQ